jgi:hypothetical protein
VGPLLEIGGGGRWGGGIDRRREQKIGLLT